MENMTLREALALACEHFGSDQALAKANAFSRNIRFSTGRCS
jgi:hypothetical protein